MLTARAAAPHAKCVHVVWHWCSRVLCGSFFAAIVMNFRGYNFFCRYAAEGYNADRLRGHGHHGSTLHVDDDEHSG